MRVVQNASCGHVLQGHGKHMMGVGPRQWRSRPSSRHLVATAALILMGAGGGHSQTSAPLTPVSEAPTSSPNVVPSIGPTSIPPSAPSATTALGHGGDTPHFLTTGDVVGVCIGANIVGIALVAASLWYNAKYPEFRATPRKSISEVYAGMTTSRPAADAGDGYIGIGGVGDPAGSMRANHGVEGHQYAEISEPGSAPTRSNPYVTLPGAVNSTSPSPEAFSDIGSDSDRGLPSPPTPPIPTMTSAQYKAVSGPITITEVIPSQAKSTRRSRSARNSKRGSRKLNKLDISGPTDFRHESHIGLGDIGADTQP
mmetsp:Transcript_31818/g.83368  ORF Transcript_31818/g.83368 Transcript_31818/m.83368 type:complete len:312 (+) Transcript_31818:47-982(+)|eukprot:CAMPEP_0182922926 /NCGR_PEP_ID=MMETSP0105_2-20130417/5109_1 /TAXON_ID=81532 ORGANISM="Acanthoeca-like sp., Strain 10tr" /NCGR_SAMPLE_ID=MMETSP0105_2 /ASSEMBLY_ACC=CAM_ASM_000205 /LENGTH=311 /DNA_ID=CAMNT_0025060587 /DNA_START=37 /DNA_END=972 /DNA_ORIENTATION=+